MKIKTSELTGQALDWAVAKCEGKNGVLHDDGITRCIVVAAASGVYKGTYKPSTNWSQGGPLGERELLTADPHLDNDCDLIQWSCRNWKGDGDYLYGPTELIAKMRAYVASKLGSEVDVPKELT